MNERTATLIGFRPDPDFNRAQYTAHAKEYIADNPHGIRGGRTPVERAAAMRRVLSAGGRLFEVGGGPGHDGVELAKYFDFTCSDVAEPFIKHQQERGLRSVYYDAQADQIPPGMNGVFAHIALQHIDPSAFAAFTSGARENLEGEKAFYFSLIEGSGHEEGTRSGFKRRWFYYPQERIRQILDQEGADIVSFERIVAENGTPTIHVSGNFSRSYNGGSYLNRFPPNHRGLHLPERLVTQPYGDVYYDINALSEGDLRREIVEAQIAKGFLDPGILDFMDAARLTYRKALSAKIPGSEITREVNAAWARALAGREVAELRTHAQEFFDARKPFRDFAAVFAISNNNGFSNTLISDLPSWLADVAARNIGAEAYLAPIWPTDTEDLLRGYLTGEVKYPYPVDPDKQTTIRAHQKRLQELLGPKYRRITVGVSSIARRSILAVTDYPILAFGGEEQKALAYTQGVFLDQRRQAIYANDHTWLKWGVLDDTMDLALYTNIATSRFPILHNTTREAKNRNRNYPLWRSTDNNLNERFYKIGDNPLIEVL